MKIKIIYKFQIPLLISFLFVIVSAPNPQDNSSLHIKENSTPGDSYNAITIDEIRQTLDDSPTGGYKIYALKVGEAESVRKSFFIRDSKKNERIHVSFYFWIISGADRMILVDTGFISRTKIRSWKIKNYKGPMELLKSLSIKPESITDIIITHRHWDHIGGLSLFQGPRIWINKGEFNDAKKKYKSKDKQIWQALVKSKESNKLVFTKRVTRIMPGIVVVVQGSHTKQFQYVIINSNGCIYVLASDVGPLYENFRDLKISGQTVDEADSLLTLKNILHFAEGNIDRIIPGHEPEVFKKFKEIVPGVVRIN